MSPSHLREEIFDLLYSKNRPEVAVLRLNQILDGMPENSEALALKSYALNKLANVSHDWKYSRSALETAERALMLNPDNDIALTGKWWALIDLGDPSLAVEILTHAVNVNPNNEYAWYNLAWAEYLIGNAAQSSESIKRALQISPGNEIISRGRRMMAAGEVPEHLKRFRGKPLS